MSCRKTNENKKLNKDDYKIVYHSQKNRTFGFLDKKANHIVKNVSC